LSKTLDFPVAYNDERIFKDIAEDQNTKYIKYHIEMEHQWLDEQVWQGIRPKKDRKNIS
jgi:hypothetical protein